MAEAIGLAASVTSLVEIASKITQLSYKYVRDVKNAAKTQRQYLQEVSAFTDTLFRVEQAIQDTGSSTILPAHPNSLSTDVLKDCHITLKSLQSDLQKRVRRILWPLQEKELRKHIDSLGRFRDIFTNYLAANVL